MAENTQIERNEDTRIYEAAFHIIPSLSESEAAATASDFRDLIEGKSSTILYTEMPQLIRLAYPMQKDIDRKRHTFTSAYFGWVVFETTADAAHEIKAALENNDKILRSLVVKTVKEAAQPHKHPAQQATPDRPVHPTHAPAREPEKAAEPMTVEAMDAEIAKLVVD